jgi:dihydrofolate synthase/folylpolyglutamate synthase
MFTSYEETLNFLYQNLPMFQRIGAAALKPDLKNTEALCEALGNPQSKFKSIHVAGTNGKGSTSHMLASILQSAGYKTGLYTSPHLKEFTERIRINGIEISKDAVVDFANLIETTIHKLKPSFFEVTVAMAFDNFAKEQVDIAIIEVGLGGRLDSTNVITPELSVITNIGWDHMDILGDSLEKIAQEKAGIIKPSIPVVISERQPEIENVFIQKALASNSNIYFASDHYKATSIGNRSQHILDLNKENRRMLSAVTLPLQGIYQKKNVVGVLQSVDILRSLGWKISEDDLLSGLQDVVSQTGLKGRWQVLHEKPFIVCDTGHNLNGIIEVLNQIKAQTYRNLWIVFGMVKGKDVTAVLRILPKEAYYFFCQAKIPRALDATLLYEEAVNFQLQGEVVEDVNDALSQATQKAAAEDMIFIGGSTFVVAEIKNL